MRFKKLRWMVAVFCLLVSVRLMAGALKIEGYGAAGPAILSVISFLVSILLISAETALPLAEWCAKPFENLFFPSDQFTKPPLSYLLARRYAREQRLEDAVGEYEKIIHYYPEERTAYRELLELTRSMGATELHEEYVALFKKHFHEDPPEEPPASP